MSTITTDTTRTSAPAPGAAGPLIQAVGVFKTYRLDRVDVPVLRGVDFTLQPGEWVAILGSSGSGKSTLLHILGGLDRPDPGARVEFKGQDLAGRTPRELDDYRNRSVGFVFQFYHLLPELSVLENAMLPAMATHGYLGFMAKRRHLTTRAKDLLERFGLGHRLRHRPSQLSGGERQRVAIARALMNEPEALLADEPTGNLDHTTGQSILDAISETRKHSGRALVIVTHDREVAARADRVVRLVDGQMVPA